MARTTRRQHRRHPALRVLGAGASFILLIAAAFAALTLVIVPAVTGSQTYSVLTNSMNPHYGPGTLLIVKPVDADTLRTGDVITYQLESGRSDVITHRIISVTADQEGNRLLLTKGDNNSAPDDNPVTEVQLRGKLFYAVPWAGYVANWLGNQDRTLAGQAAAAVLIAYGAGTMIREVLRRRRTSTTAASTDTAPDAVVEGAHR
ncbi:signal peptidase I [Pseudarthrobacter sp. NPDC058329]|uniref:signal peptidase I n=1 Tax=Pseudarthrobacter sp. NPDC058329 TaxID=3346448 RepID=UPI0036DE3675